MHVCMSAYVYISIYVCMRICTYLCMFFRFVLYQALCLHPVDVAKALTVPVTDCSKVSLGTY